MRHPGAIAGFTIVEVLIVAVLMALAAGMAAGMNYRVGEYMQLRAAARDVLGFFNGCRARALLEGESVTCVYDPESRTLSAAPGDREITLPGELTMASAALDIEPVPPQEPDTLAVFYPDGSSGGGNLAILGDTRRMYLLLDPLFGSVQLARTLPGSEGGS